MPLAYHLVARARPGLLLFTDAAEGARLWRTIVAAAPQLEALVLMPNHIHLVHAHDVRLPLAKALGRYARWHNRLWGRRGPLLEPLPAAEPLADRQKLRRTVRYVHLNPCRARLAPDPLAWPWSTHRDRVGLALEPAVPRASQPHRFHRYVSGDPTVHPEGTELPQPLGMPPAPTQVVATVASLARLPERDLTRRGRWRTLALGVAWSLCDAPRQKVRAALRVGKDAAVVRPERRVMHAVERAVHDPRLHEPEPPRRWRLRAQAG